MMRKRILFLLVLLIGSGCEKYLETAPDLRAKVDSPEKVAELLASAYPQANYITFMEAMSDNAGDKGAAAGGGTPVNADPWRFEDVRARDQDSPDFYWYGCYAAIAAANRALAIIDAVEDSENYRSQRAEALVARAYAHFMLVTLFAKTYNPITADTDPGIPYVTEPEEVVLLKYERKTVAYVYEMIENDLLAGLPDLDDSRYKAPKFHFTTTAAHAFAARFYMFKRDYRKVVEHASQVFRSDHVAGYLRPINEQSYRSMEFAQKLVDYTHSNNPANLLLVEAPSLWGRSYTTYRYAFSAALVSELYFTPNVTGGQYAYMVYGGNDRTYNTPKFREHFVRSGLNANFGSAYNMIPLFVAEEVLLNRAEAYAMLGEYDAAVIDLNTFASKKVYASQNNPFYYPSVHVITPSKLNAFYNSPNLQKNIVSAALDFKRREFLFEGIRWLDILRHGITVTHTSHNLQETHVLGPNDPRRVLQLPQEVVLSGMEPNPR